MPKKPAPLAKLTRPRLYKAVARERLFRLLDEKREHPVVWIAESPWAGKASLAANDLKGSGSGGHRVSKKSGRQRSCGLHLFPKQRVEGVGLRVLAHSLASGMRCAVAVDV